MNELHLFAGCGGGILGGILLGHTCVCAVEIEPYCRKVLFRRQRDGVLPRFPIWDDIKTFDGTPWRGRVDVVCGGFPCQGISASGPGGGIDGDKRSGLWIEMERVIGEVGPKFVFVENSPKLTIRGLYRVLGGLSGMGYNAQWGTLGADAVGLPHRRSRIWVAAYSQKIYGNSRNLLGTRGLKREGQFRRFPSTTISQDWRTASQGTVGVGIFRDPIDGMAAEVGELAALGNGQVPAVAQLAWNTLMPK